MPPPRHFAKCAEDFETKELGADFAAPVCEECAQEYQNKGDAPWRPHKKRQKSVESIENKQFKPARIAHGGREDRESHRKHRTC